MKHPKFMTEELLDRLSSNPDDPKTIKAVDAQTRKGLDYWSAIINGAVGYVNAFESPIIIAAMRNVADEFEKHFETKEAVEDIRNHFGYTSLVKSRQIIDPEDLK